MAFINNIFRELRERYENQQSPAIEREKLEQKAIKKYFDRNNANIYYISQRMVKEAISMEHSNADIATTKRAINKLKEADRLQKAYEDGINDLRKQFLGMPTTQWYIDYDLDYPNKN